jgi:hypothetical protein
MSTTFYRAADQVQAKVASYTPGSGSLTVQSGGGDQFAVPLAATGQILITAVTAVTNGTFPETYGEYSCTGVSGDTLTGLALVKGTDGPWQFGDFVQMRTCAGHINNLQDTFTALPGISPVPVSTNASLSPGVLAICSATSASITLALPTAPVDGTIGGAFVAGITGTHTVTVTTGGSDVLFAVGGATSIVLNIATQILLVQYNASNATWAPFAVPVPPPNQGSGISITINNGVPTISATNSGSGTVTSASVVTANGFAGTVANATTTPAITLTTSVSGMLKGASGAITQGTPGTDYVVPSGSITGTAGNITGSIPVSQVTGLSATLSTIASEISTLGSDTITITAGSGLTGGGAVSLGGSVTLAATGGGGGGTPGGSNGQVQFNNDGVFGGNANLILPSTGPARFLGGPWINVTGPGNAIVNTTTQTSIFTGATFRSGQSLTLPANSLQAGDEIEFVLFGTFGCNGTPNIAIKILLNNFVIFQGTAGMSQSTTNGAWFISNTPTYLWFPQVGTTGTCTGLGGMSAINDAATNTLSSAVLYSLTESGSGTGTLNNVDTTQALPLDIQVAWNTADPANTWQLLGGTIKKSG